MKLTYDKIADCLGITFKEGVVDETREIAPEVNLDVDAMGVPLYLEIIGAAEKFGRDKVGELLVQNWIYDEQKIASGAVV